MPLDLFQEERQPLDLFADDKQPLDLFPEEARKRPSGAGGGFPLTFGQKAIQLITGRHISYEPTTEEVSRILGTEELSIVEPATAGMGFFEDPVTAVAFGATAGARLVAAPVQRFLRGLREAAGWMTGGATEIPAITKMGARGAARIISAKQIEKTMAPAVVKPFGQVPQKIIPKKGLTGLPATGARVMSLIKDRRANIDKAVLDSEAFIRPLERQFTKMELEAVPFIRQGIKDPEVLKKINRGDLIPTIKNPSPELLQATKKIGKYYDEAHQFLKENWGDVGFVKDYVTQIWDIPKARKTEVLNYFVTHNPFTKKRVIPTLEEGIKLGLKPKTTNIAELLRIYDQYKIKAVFNRKFAEGLKGMTDDASKPLMMRYDKAPEDWVTIRHPALERAMMIGKLKGKTKGIVLKKAAVSVHPDIAKEVKIIFDKPFSHGAIRALETVNAFTKKSMLSVTFFHHWALTESAFSTGIGKKAASMWNPVKIIRALRFKDYGIYKDIPLAKDAIEHGVMFGALEDIQRSKVERALQGLERVAQRIPIARSITKGMRKGNELWDAALWDYYHNNLKLYAYEENVFRSLKAAKKRLGRELVPEEITGIKNEMGKFVNDSFGGQNWELNRILGNPKSRQMMHWLLLAPDWTFSVLKQAIAPAKGVYLQATGKKLAGKALTKRGTLFWARAMLYYNTIAQSVNFYNTKKEYGKGRFTWENAPGHALNIFMGRNEDGTEKYLRMGKQFREVMEWGYEPVKKLGAKLSPVIRETMRQITRHDPGSGYPTEFAETESILEDLKERGLSIAEMPIPFSLRGYVKSRPGSYMFTFPTSRGMTNYKGIKLFKKAIKTEDADRVKRVYFSALENNLDAEQLFASAKAAVKADMTFDNKKMAREILKELKGLDAKARIDAFDLYRQRGIITPEIGEQINKLLETKESVERQKAIFRIKGSQ